MKLLFGFLLSTLVSLGTFAQTVVWSDPIEVATAGSWTLNVPTGVNGSDPNYWEIDDDEAGVLPPGCGTAGTGDASLHITSVFNPNGGAAYDAGGLCGILFCPEANTRAESPTISTVAYPNSVTNPLTLSFDFISEGEGLNDNASVWYNDGSGWTVLDPSIKSNNASCSPQGTWTAYSVPLPASCNGIANLQIGFNWTNNDDGAGSDPSVAINAVQITTPSVGTPPVADFSADVTTICVGDIVTFTDLSTNTPTTWDWNFDNTAIGGASPSTSNVSGPIQVTYNTAGSYEVSLTVSNADGSDTEIKTAYIQVTAAANAGTSATQSYCSTDAPEDLFTLLGGADAGGTWTPSAGAPALSGSTFDPASTSGPYPETHTYTYDVGSGSCADQATVTVTVNDCSNPTADFTVNQTNICAGDCVTFTDASTGTNINSWTWDFGAGASPATGNGQGPHNVCYNTAGTYTISLTIVDANGTDTQTQTNLIVVDAAPNAGTSGSHAFCTGDAPANLFSDLGGSPDATGSWTPALAGGNLGTFDPATDSPGTYTYTVPGSGACASASSTVVVSVSSCTSTQALFTATDSIICQGNCIDFIDMSTGTNVQSWQWDFGSGATPATFSGQNPPTVCYDMAGNYTVTLTVTDDLGTDSHTMNVVVNPGPVADLGPDLDLCQGMTATLDANASGTYLWSTTQTSQTILVSNSDDYYVEVTNNGCSSSDTVTVTFHEPIIASLTAFTTSCATKKDGEIYINLLQGDTIAPLTVNWSNGETSNPLTGAEPGYYWATISNEYGCTFDTDTVTVYASPDSCPILDIFIPNIFSPNGDGWNDYLEIKHQGIEDFEIVIYNRFGEKVWETRDLNDKWDGTYRGVLVDDAVFVYHLRGMTIEGQVFDKKGNITVIH